MTPGAWLNYHHLYYFYIIATEQSVTKASRKLRLAQSTLSAQLLQFEAQIDAQLFDRKNKQLELTDIGRRVYEYASQIFVIGNELKDMLRDRDKHETVHIQIGVLDTVPKTVVEQIAGEAAGLKSAIVSIVEGTLEKHLRELSQFSLDLVVTNAQPPADIGFKIFTRLVGDMEVDVVAAPKFAALREGFPTSLNEQPFVVASQGTASRLELDSYLKLNHLHPEVRFEVDDLDLQRRLAIAGHGITLLPSLATGEDLASGKLVKLSSIPVMREKIWLIASQRLIQNKTAQHLLKNFALVGV